MQLTNSEKQASEDNSGQVSPIILQISIITPIFSYVLYLYFVDL